MFIFSNRKRIIFSRDRACPCPNKRKRVGRVAQATRQAEFCRAVPPLAGQPDLLSTICPNKRKDSHKGCPY